ncbi:MAG TPA: hypothetical protein VFM16_08325 [Holophagaceae bacterium]|nr:hypothetical protein [Holophagaceae bacterium]
MLPQALIFTGLFPVLLQAQPAPSAPPAISILLNAEPPSDGATALDLDRLNEALRAWTTVQHAASPTQNGDSWVLRIDLKVARTPYQSLESSGLLQLSRLREGKVSESPISRADFRVFARDAAHLNGALADELVRRSWALLASAHALPADPTPDLGKIHEPVLEAGGEVLDMLFPQVGVKAQPPLGTAPGGNAGQKPLGSYLFEVTADPEGIPESVSVDQAPALLVDKVGSWLLDWRFDGAQHAGHPVRARFQIRLNFRYF